MLQPLIILFVCILIVKTSEVCNFKYCLSTSGSELATNMEEAKLKCKNSWLLEMYDENVIAMLPRLNVNTQQHGILLGMKPDSNSWMWSDGKTFSEIVLDQDGVPTRVVAYVTQDVRYIETDNILIDVKYSAKTILDPADGVICSKVATKDNCAEWFHNGLCYFKLIVTTCTWFQAHNECIKHGASMAIFSYPLTNVNLSFTDNLKYWVSLSRNSWKWIQRGELVTFNKWLFGQPDSSNNKFCATTNADGNDWKLVNCKGTFNIVCMRENYESSTAPSTYVISVINVTNATESPIGESLSIGAKAGIGVGVSLFIIIIIVIGVLIFKYFHVFKPKPQGQIKSGEVYEKPDFNNSPNHIYQGLETN